MNDDDLLKRLGAVAREQRSEKPDGEPPSLDADARARISDALASRMAPKVAKPIGAVDRPGRARVVAFVGGGLALAAALVLVLRRPEATGTGGTPGAFPGYTFDDSAVAAMRGPASSAAPSRDCKIHANDHAAFTIVARPDDAVAGRVDAYAFVVRGDDVIPWRTGADLAESGAVKLSGPTHVLADVDELRLVVGRGLAAPDALAMAKGNAARGPTWQVLRCAVVR